MEQVIAIAGLGLIGGSLAQDLASQGATILGYDRDPETIRAARSAGVIAASLGPDLAGVEEADLLILATPIPVALALLESAAPRLRQLRLVTDVGSTKREIVSAAEGLGLGSRFVGAHPLAGDHRTGWSSARRGLFQGARIFLSPSVDTSHGALEEARSLWGRVGGRPEELGAAEHDRMVAWTSHLPQAVSSALAIVLSGEGLGIGELGPGGRDLTRLAASSPELWTGIALSNADLLSAALLDLECRLRQLRGALEETDQQAVRTFFEAGRRWSSGSTLGDSPSLAAEVLRSPVDACDAEGFPTGG